MRDITIAIDGYSSTGKSTIAKMLASKLGYVYVDSGAMYRAVSLYALQNEFIKGHYFDKQGLVASLDAVKLEFVFNKELSYSEIFLNGKNVERQIRTMEVSEVVSRVAAVPEVRRAMVALQHKMGEDKGIVMDGRDIGTVVFPDAELKIFMTASPEIRAKRRYDELIAKGEDVNYETVLENVQNRDYIDSTRKDSPLTQAEDAIAFDNSELSIDQQFEKVMRLARMALEDQE